jgi:Surfeit locus protein 5 subunit 22 of Mediator complex
LAQSLSLKTTADNLISDCNDLLKLTNSLKKKLLLSDVAQINQEVAEAGVKQGEMLEDEAARIVAMIQEI